MVSPYLLNMPNLLLLKYNNYYNRTLKGYSNIDGYKNAVGTSGYAEVTNVNFNPRDGISSYHTVNTNFDCDYLLVIESTQPWNIISRWFVIESHYDRVDQRTLILRRDVLYDYSSSYGNAPAFIEKGALSASDPFIFNPEEMTFNQIYRSRQFIQDVTIRPWIVLYVAKNRTEDVEINIKLNNLQGSEKIYYTLKHYSHTDNCAYDIFCIPTGSTWTSTVNSVNYKSKNDNLPFAIAAAFSEWGSGGGVVYDIQLLPYCPIQKQSGWSVTANKGTYSGSTVDTDVLTAKSNMTSEYFSASDYPVVMRVASQNLQFIRSNISYGRDIHTAIGMKVDSCTRFCRLVSPSGGSSFQFNAAKMWGPSEATQFVFNIKCTFMPYTPYIHVYPNFGGLYGIPQDKDQRGLICGGDFSLPQVNDKWQTYQINNKNYQKIFDRQIENMEITNAWSTAKEAVGALSGAVSGAAGGAMVAGTGGAIAGAVTGVVGGLADVLSGSAMRQEQLDYTKDMFGYNLQNIQALPNSIIKTNSFVVDSLIYPAFDIYTATDQEEAALKNKIKYNGMSVGRIGTFNEFKSAATSDCRYVKCKIIRMDSLHEETSVANAIYSELNQGVFIS